MDHDRVRNNLAKTMLQYEKMHRDMQKGLLDCGIINYSEHMQKMVMPMMICAETYNLLLALHKDAESSEDLEVTLGTHLTMAKIVVSGGGGPFEGDTPTVLAGISNYESHEDLVTIIEALAGGDE